MGLTPRQVDDLSIWEFAACFETWQRVHASEEDRAMTRDEYSSAVELLNRIEGRV